MVDRSFQNNGLVNQPTTESQESLDTESQISISSLFENDIVMGNWINDQDESLNPHSYNVQSNKIAFQRVNITGEENLISADEKRKVSQTIMWCIATRIKYMKLSQQIFSHTTLQYFNMINESKSSNELLQKLKNLNIDQQKNLKETKSKVNEKARESISWPVNVSIDKGIINLSLENKHVKVQTSELITEETSKTNKTELPDEKSKLLSKLNDTSIKVSNKDNQQTQKLKVENNFSRSKILKFIRSVLNNIPEVDRTEYIKDSKKIKHMCFDGMLRSYCYQRLMFIYSKFQMHVLLNKDLESTEQKNISHRDFYNIRKVDNHIHAASSMNQKHLLRFIKKTLKTNPNMLVYRDENTGKEGTLEDLFKRINVTPYELSIDKLDVHCGNTTFQRFDKFNLKYNPVGVGELREVFLKSSNICDGKFFAEIVKEVLADIEESKYQYTELRLSIYGRSMNEWQDLAKWIKTHKVYSSHNVWIIQIPRLYEVYRSKSYIKNFQEFLNNIFRPLFLATLQPTKYPILTEFLKSVVGIDSVDDESKQDKGPMYSAIPHPNQWNSNDNPPYDYYIYYIYANLVKLNYLREIRGMNKLTLRPHCGESGHFYHLITSFLLAENINHGLILRKNPFLQYLYYICQIPISMSPLSNNSLFLNYYRNPLPDFFAKGLKVTLSTDDPLQFHYTKEPLMEEYSVATQVWKLSATDMCELARNSILMSGFSKTVKEEWLGKSYEFDDVQSNSVMFSNVPNVRIAYRLETLIEEMLHLMTYIIHSDINFVIKSKS